MFWRKYLKYSNFPDVKDYFCLRLIGIRLSYKCIKVFVPIWQMRVRYLHFPTFLLLFLKKFVSSLSSSCTFFCFGDRFHRCHFAPTHFFTALLPHIQCLSALTSVHIPARLQDVLLKSLLQAASTTETSTLCSTRCMDIIQDDQGNNNHKNQSHPRN